MTRARLSSVAPFFSVLVLAGGLSSAVAIVACGSAPPPPAENHTFFQDDQPMGAQSRYERPYPPLDASADPKAGAPDLVGVAILEGTVRFARPTTWKIRRASLEPGARFVEYVSPEEYLFTVYERLDGAGDSWKDVLGNYEDDAREAGAEVSAGGIPVASDHAQGRTYVVHRKVRGARGSFLNTIQETVYRGTDHVELVQIVHQGDSLAAIAPTLLRVTDSLDVR